MTVIDAAYWGHQATVTLGPGLAGAAAVVLLGRGLVRLCNYAADRRTVTARRRALAAKRRAAAELRGEPQLSAIEGLEELEADLDAEWTRLTNQPRKEEL
ncbi:hypothetical protein [Streptomyces sp. MZ04]|uniref:hypothetical protein n=1 Tax=Streptomyces sp. MZ04 TaxID=2559236 RepID=UPI00107E73F6|nr:hypothetical protein [Streptomyces sp. MZ04]TGB11579.1 hypothetical protein E2651_12935 [Streptomyces sp. MZ04]